MGFFDFISRRTENRQELMADDVLLTAIFGKSGITRSKIKQIPAVNECVDMISNTFASIPIKLYQETFNDQGKKKVDEITDHRYKMLNEENEDLLDARQMKKALCEDYLLDKGGYLFIDKSGKTFKNLIYVKSEQVGISIDDSNPLVKIVDFMVGASTYDESQFIKVCRATRNGVTGTGLCEEIKTALNSALARLEYEFQLAKTGGSRKGFLKSKTRLTKENMEALKNSWENYYQGNSNTVILNDGLEFQEASNTSKENEIAMKNDAFAKDIRALFHIKEDYTRYVDDAVMPIVDAFISQLNKYLLTEDEKEQGYYFAPDTKDVYRCSLSERTSFYKEAIMAGWMSRNEVRYLENMEQKEGLDTFSGSLGETMINGETGTVYTPNTNQVKDGDMVLDKGGETIAT